MKDEGDSGSSFSAGEFTHHQNKQHVCVFQQIRDVSSQFSAGCNKACSII